MKTKTALLLFVLLVSFSLAQNKITASVISSGGATVSNSNYILSGTLGESFIGTSSTSVNSASAGFWSIYTNDIISSVENEDGLIPTVFNLEQNYPNPFNPVTIIKFGIPEPCNVSVKIYDVLGSEVLTLLSENLQPGWYKKEFNASGLSSGMYIYRIIAGSYKNTKKMLMIK